MIASVHLADVGPHRALTLLGRAPRPSAPAGVRYAQTAIAAAIAPGLLPRLRPSRIGLIAFWENDSALDRFLSAHSLSQHLASGWHARMNPLRASGTWPGLEELSDRRASDQHGPVAVLTLGRLRLTNTVRFLQANAPAAGMASSDPALLAATALAAPPNLVCTFSLWRDTASLRAYAYGHSGPAHLAVIQAHKHRPFHHQSAFIRLHPYAQSGSCGDFTALTDEPR
jgi:hypothetical protein